MSPLSQKLSELWPFSWVKSWQNLKSIKFSNLKISMTFWDLDQFFFSCEVNLYFWKHIQSFKVKQQFRALKLNPGTLCPPPGKLPGSETPGLIGLNKLRLSWAKLKLSLSYSFINFELTFKISMGLGWSTKCN